MAPKEKAIELRNKFRDVRWDLDPDTCKQCALIAVDEILDLSQIASFRRDKVYMEMEYWGEVIKEINNL